jgi:proteasome lid subunit RPN8/RPN11
MQNRKLRIPFTVWINLIYDLRKRGNGTRESGAFLLGSHSADMDKIKKYICYDDLDPHALDKGFVILKSTGFSALWDYCRKYDLEILGDIHTHPGKIARQSETDRVNPMISEKGHIALILPEYARAWCWFMQNIAVYEYVGAYTWRDWTGNARTHRVQLSWW